LFTIVVLAGARADRGTPFERLATNPERFLGEEVRVTGRIVARPTRDERVVLENANGQRLLLVPPKESRLPIGVRVAVRGRVALRVDDLAVRSGTSTILLASELSARAG
jgi:hypothetical protein